jgi:iron complex transport system permease protein
MADNRIPQFQSYNAFIRRKRLVFFIVILATIVVALFAIGAGSLNIPCRRHQNAIGKGTVMSHQVILGIRLPRIVAAVVVGSSLAVSGAVMQCVLQNPLAAASTLGVSQGAAFGAALGIIVFGGGVVNSDSAATAIAINNPYIVTLCAFIFGSLSTAVVILLSKFRKDLGPGGLILAGVALSSLFTGGSALLQYFADETKVSALCSGLSGTWERRWVEIIIIAAVLVAATTYFVFNRWNYNAIESGADTAKSSASTPGRSC